MVHVRTKVPGVGVAEEVDGEDGEDARDDHEDHQGREHRHHRCSILCGIVLDCVGLCSILYYIMYGDHEHHKGREHRQQRCADLF